MRGPKIFFGRVSFRDRRSSLDPRYDGAARRPDIGGGMQESSEKSSNVWVLTLTSVASFMGALDILVVGRAKGVGVISF
jgi:hypothetical protein